VHPGLVEKIDKHLSAKPALCEAAKALSGQSCQNLEEKI